MVEVHDGQNDLDDLPAFEPSSVGYHRADRLDEVPGIIPVADRVVGHAANFALVSSSLEDARADLSEPVRRVAAEVFRPDRHVYP